MSDLDREYRDPGSGGDSRSRQFLARLFENPENPLTWSLFLFRFRGISVRVHLFTVIYIIATLLWSIPQSNGGIGFMSLAMASLFIIVLLHEFGHCFACRWVGGEADRIVMLPFGGLALTRPPNDPRSNFITTFGGPAVNIAIIPVTTGLLLALGLASTLVFNPFAPIATLSDPAIASSSTFMFWVKVGVWWFHYINLVILAFNLLLPIFPLDGGRLVHAVVWSRTNFRKATEIAVMSGYVGAMVLFVVGLLTRSTMLMAIALFGGFSCWMERRRFMADEELAAAGYTAPFGGYEGADEGGVDPGPSRAERRRREAEERDQAELDRLLEKISAEGIGSLSRKERATLDHLSKKKRGG